MSYYIAPDSDLYVCKGVPLDTDYKNTLYWSTTSGGSSAGMASQEEYFISTMKYKYDKLSYQRVEKGKIRIEQCADDLYDCNYMMFRNTAFGDKWWYAFITGVEYINNVTSEISYEIDVMQTWFFSYDLAYCFVEREHVDDDTIGANLVSEEINYGDVKCTAMKRTEYFDSYVYMVASSTNLNLTEKIDCSVTTGIVSGLNYLRFETATSLENWLDEVTSDNKSDTIVSIWMQPDGFSGVAADIKTYDTHDVTVDFPTTIDGYTPRNNKLFTYPYTSLYVDCGNDTAEYRYEWFDADYEFRLQGTISPTPEVICAPYKYNSSVDDYNFNESIIMRGFPQIAWTIDTYKNWVASGGLANNFLQVTAGVARVGAGGAMVASGKSGNMIRGANTAINGALQTASSIVERLNIESKGPTAHGMQGSDVTVGNCTKDFYFKTMQIQSEFARSIDNYFTMFGYRVNRVKQPNRNSREKWNYVKTAGCTILPTSIPADDVARIEQIYDNGITFWHSADYVGHYNLQNPIV